MSCSVEDSNPSSPNIGSTISIIVKDFTSKKGCLPGCQASFVLKEDLNLYETSSSDLKELGFNHLDIFDKIFLHEFNADLTLDIAKASKCNQCSLNLKNCITSGSDLFMEESLGKKGKQDSKKSYSQKKHGHKNSSQKTEKSHSESSKIDSLKETHNRSQKTKDTCNIDLDSDIIVKTVRDNKDKSKKELCLQVSHVKSHRKDSSRKKDSTSHESRKKSLSTDKDSSMDRSSVKSCLKGSLQEREKSLRETSQSLCSKQFKEKEQLIDTTIPSKSSKKENTVMKEITIHNTPVKSDRKERSRKKESSIAIDASDQSSEKRPLRIEEIVVDVTPTKSSRHEPSVRKEININSTKSVKSSGRRESSGTKRICIQDTPVNAFAKEKGEFKEGALNKLSKPVKRIRSSSSGESTKNLVVPTEIVCEFSEEPGKLKATNKIVNLEMSPSILSKIMSTEESCSPNKESNSFSPTTEYDYGAWNPVKKSCTFPVRRTKSKPLPILEDDQLPRKKAPPLCASKKSPNVVSPLKNKGVLDYQNLVITSEDDSHNLAVQESTFSSTEKDLLAVKEDNEELEKDDFSFKTSQDPRMESQLLDPALDSSDSNENEEHDSKQDSTMKSESTQRLSNSQNESNSLKSDKTESQHYSNMEESISHVSNSEHDNLLGIAPKLETNRSQYDNEFLDSKDSTYIEASLKCKDVLPIKDKESELPKLSDASIPLSLSDSIPPGNDFDSNRVMHLLQLINDSKTYLGCFEDSFTLFYIEANIASRAGSMGLLNFLKEMSSMNLLKASLQILFSLNDHELTFCQSENVYSSRNALEEVINRTEKASRSAKFIDIKKLALSTCHLKSSEIPDFLKLFFKFKKFELDEPKHFDYICRNVMKCRIDMSVERKKTSLVSEDFRSNIEKVIQSDCKTGSSVNERLFSSDPSGNRLFQKSPFYKNENSVETERFSLAVPETKSNNMDRTTNNQSNSQMSNSVVAGPGKPSLVLNKKDLERLVENYWLLDGEMREAIKNYILCLQTSEPQYAIALLRRIDILSSQ